MPRVSRAESANRPKRTPLGLRNVLTAETRDGYVRRWFNDTDDRIERAKEAGYTEVIKSSAKVGDEMAGADSQMGSLVSKSVGGGMRAVLMEIPEEFYREDQEAKQERVDAREAGLRPRSDVKGKQYGGFYGDSKIKRGKHGVEIDNDPQD